MVDGKKVNGISRNKIRNVGRLLKPFNDWTSVGEEVAMADLLHLQENYRLAGGANRKTTDSSTADLQ